MNCGSAHVLPKQAAPVSRVGVLRGKISNFAEVGRASVDRQPAIVVVEFLYCLVAKRWALKVPQKRPTVF